MMISPEGYYNEYLRGKTAEQIMTAIRELKQEIDRLKNRMEHPDYPLKPDTRPSAATQLYYSRLYLEKAKAALEEAGGSYEPSGTEQQADAFDASISSISKMVFSIGTCFAGFEIRTYRLDEMHLYMEIEHSHYRKPSNLEIPPDYPVDKATFLDGLMNLHIGEWCSHYDIERFGYCVCDGKEWSLEIWFSDGHKPVKFDGSNAYPYNFNDLLRLLDIDREDETEED